jgi:hypothetical protein
MNNWNKIVKLPWPAFMAAFGVIVFGNLSASALNGEPLYKWLDPNGCYQGWTNAATVLLLCISFGYIYWHRSQFQSIRMIAQKDNTDLHTGIILLLSPPSDKVFSAELLPIKVKNPEKNIDVIVPGNKNISGEELMKWDIGQLEGTKWTWQQMLRGVCYHINTVKFIYIVGSKDTIKTETREVTIIGSFPRLKNAKALLQAYIPDLNIKTHETPIDFEDFNELRSALGTGIKWVRDNEVADKDIVIDITGGMKISSVTGAMVTLDNNITFQTVQTSGDCKVISFDVVIQAPASAF